MELISDGDGIIEIPLKVRETPIRQGLPVEDSSALPHFPLSPKPRCRFCGWTPERPTIASPHNPNDNAGRPYYKCDSCESRRKLGIVIPGDDWITWDDGKGVHIDNPRCHCDVPSRQDRAGTNTTIPGWGFWRCATGNCGYYSECRNGQTKEQQQCDPTVKGGEPFKPWLLSGLS